VEKLIVEKDQVRDSLALDKQLKLIFPSNQDVIVQTLNFFNLVEKKRTFKH
jgi:hypothetical protein